MNRKMKLVILILLSLSVYFIYKNTDNHKKILILGDYLAIGNTKNNFPNSLEKLINDKATINNTYNKKELTIEETILLIENNSRIKKDLLESHFLIINLGYNDYLITDTYQKEKINETSPTEDLQIKIKNLLLQIRKYYKRPILVIGYPERDTITNKVNLLWKEKEVLYLDPNQYLNTKEILLNMQECQLLGIEIKKILEKEQII